MRPLWTPERDKLLEEYAAEGLNSIEASKRLHVSPNEACQRLYEIHRHREIVAWRSRG